MLKRDEELGPHLAEISKGNLQVPMRQTRGPTVFLYHGLHSDIPSKILFLSFRVRSKEQLYRPLGQDFSSCIVFLSQIIKKIALTRPLS